MTFFIQVLLFRRKRYKSYRVVFYEDEDLKNMNHHTSTYIFLIPGQHFQIKHSSWYAIRHNLIFNQQFSSKIHFTKYFPNRERFLNNFHGETKVIKYRHHLKTVKLNSSEISNTYGNSYSSFINMKKRLFNFCFFHFAFSQNKK